MVIGAGGLGGNYPIARALSLQFDMPVIFGTLNLVVLLRELSET